MRKHCRAARTRGKRVLTAANRMVCYFAYRQPSERWREWNYRTVSLQQAQRLVAAGEAEQVVREWQGHVQVVGYRATKPTSWERTLATTVAVGNAASPDAQLSRSERRHVAKFKVWPLIGDTRAVAVRPKISEAERAHAAQVLADGQWPRRTVSDGTGDRLKTEP